MTRPVNVPPAGTSLDAADPHWALDRAWREERGTVLATVARRVGDLQLAEDAVQEAFAAATVRWPIDGIPTVRGHG